MNRKAQLEQEAAQVAAMINAARDAGRDYFRKRNDDMLIAVCREGSQRFGDSPRTIAFLQGYIAARAQHEEFLLESDR